jgi:hypothetical protein
MSEIGPVFLWMQEPVLTDQHNQVEDMQGSKRDQTMTKALTISALLASAVLLGACAQPAAVTAPVSVDAPSSKL